LIELSREEREVERPRDAVQHRPTLLGERDRVFAAAAGVSRATVFNRFGSKPGVLQALFTRGMQGPEMQAITEALAIEDPVAALEAVIEAACAIWEAYGDVHLQLQAVGTLEPDATALVDEQRERQRAELEELTRRLAKAGRLRPGLGQARATAARHMLTSLESFPAEARLRPLRAPDA
jgi:AcrR family transcriptional regulator